MDIEEGIEVFPVLRLTEEGEDRTQGAVAREFPITIILNDEELVTLLGSPTDLEYLAVGFLASEGLLKSKDEIKSITADYKTGVVRLETLVKRELAQDTLFKRVISTGCGRGASFYSVADAVDQKVDSQMKISVGEVVSLTTEFQRRSRTWLATHGVHGAALCDTKSILAFNEDVGRHNAIDKVFGECLLKDIPTSDRAVLTTGRVTSEILHKVSKRGIPIVISISAPTNLGVKIADALGITLMASARGKRMRVYTDDWRVVRNKTRAV